MHTPTPLPDPEKALARAAADLRAERSARGPGIPDIDSVAPHFPEFEFERLIGRGGMGAVFRAVHRPSERTVAVKLLPRHLADEPAFVERFAREARSLARLDHRNVLRVIDYGERGGHCYLVTEWIDGLDLRQLLDLGRVSTAEVLEIVPQLCAGISYAHDQGVIHRDIKPENVLIDQDGRVTIVDFGLAKLVDGEAGAVTLTTAAGALGTPHYMAPEQLEDPALVDERADLYSLGVVFYELLTGRLPMGRFEPPSARAGLEPRVAAGLDRVILKCLSQSPGDRHASVARFGRDLEAAILGQPVESDRPSGAKRGRSRARGRGPGADRPRHPERLLAVGLGLFAALVLSVLLGGGELAGLHIVLLFATLCVLSTATFFGVRELRQMMRGRSPVHRALPVSLAAWLLPVWIVCIPCLGAFAPFGLGTLVVFAACLLVVTGLVAWFSAEWVRREAEGRAALEEGR